MLIYGYGQYWNPDIVPWNESNLAGVIQHKVKTRPKTNADTNDKSEESPKQRSITKTIEMNFWDARGIYVLHSDFKTIYVGKAFKTSIGRRLSDHLKDRLAGRWDMFSWYSMSKVNVTSASIALPPKSKNVNFETINNTLEALAILIADPALNRKRESLKGAYEAYQKEQKNPMTIRTYLQKILDSMPQNSSPNSANP